VPNAQFFGGIDEVQVYDHALSAAEVMSTAGYPCLAAQPSVTTNPSSQTVTSGQTATFVAAASGNPSPTVQWQVSTDGATSWSDLPGSTQLTLSFTAGSSQSGNEYRAVFTNVAGSATTLPATLTVLSSTTGGGGGNGDGSPGVGATPELDSLALFGSGILGVLGFIRLRKRARNNS
jgi:hypothetical protein